MVALTDSEILDELKKFGITSASELKAYYREYSEYFFLQYISEILPD